MPTYALNKLVRNLAAQTMEADGATVAHHTLEADAFVAALHEKLREEVAELAAAQGSPAYVDELADVLELIHTLAEAHAIPLPDLEARRAAKAAKRGSFSQRTFITTVACPAGNPWDAYFAATPDKTPQVG
jgi:predicted house-cleaning noncanonical NTP pyrophosphatase (MazG superfamily)